MTFLTFILCAPSPIMPFILALMQKSRWLAPKLGGDERFTTLTFSTRNSWQWKEI